MKEKVKPIKLEESLVDEMKQVAGQLGFKKVSEFLRVWWHNPIEMSKMVERAKQELSNGDE